MKASRCGNEGKKCLTGKKRVEKGRWKKKKYLRAGNILFLFSCSVAARQRHLSIRVPSFLPP